MVSVLDGRLSLPTTSFFNGIFGVVFPFSGTTTGASLSFGFAGFFGPLGGLFFAPGLGFGFPLITSCLDRGLSSGFQVKPVRNTSSLSSFIGVLAPSVTLMV
ncbi:hypothetical protein D3C72_1942560 [compost metagenome]